jgi:DnaJ-class molecular chaperone
LFGAVLSDPKKRTMYDAVLYDPQEEDEVNNVFDVVICFLNFSSMNFLFIGKKNDGSDRLPNWFLFLGIF